MKNGIHYEKAVSHIQNMGKSMENELISLTNKWHRKQIRGRTVIDEKKFKRDFNQTQCMDFGF